MKLATTTGDLVYYSRDPAEAVRTFEGTGFRHLDYTFWRTGWGDRPILKDNWMEPIKGAAKEAERLNFDFVQAHSPGNNVLDKNEEEYENVVEMNKRAIEACGYLGIKKIVVHSGSRDDILYPDDKEKYFTEAKKFYERLFPSMEKYGVKVLVENGGKHRDGGSFFLYTAQDMADFIDYCGHPLLGACWDTGHGNLETPHPYDSLMLLGDRLEALHVQDNFSTHDDHLAPFMGTLDVDGVMNALLDGSFAKRGCYFTFECDNILAQNGGGGIERRHDPRFEKKAYMPTLALKKASAAFLYEIGKTILQAYDCFEE